MSQVRIYNSGDTYSLYAVVKYTPSVFSTYEKTGEFYMSLISNNTGNKPDINPQDWLLIPHQNEVPFHVALPNGEYPSDYYSEFTVSFGEKRNTFHSFYTPQPKSYLKYLDTYLSPDPIHQSHVYEHNTGYDTNNWCMFYAGDDEDGNLYYVFSRPANASKMYDALEFNSQITPKRVDQFTELHQTFMLESDFEDINGQYAVATRNDILTSTTGSNEDDTSKLWGDFSVVKVTFEKGKFQKISESIIKFVPLARDFRS